MMSRFAPPKLLGRIASKAGLLINEPRRHAPVFRYGVRHGHRQRASRQSDQRRDVQVRDDSWPSPNN